MKWCSKGSHNIRTNTNSSILKPVMKKYLKISLKRIRIIMIIRMIIIIIIMRVSLKMTFLVSVYGLRRNWNL